MATVIIFAEHTQLWFLTIATEVTDDCNCGYRCARAFSAVDSRDTMCHSSEPSAFANVCMYMYMYHVYMYMYKCVHDVQNHSEFLFIFTQTLISEPFTHIDLRSKSFQLRMIPSNFWFDVTDFTWEICIYIHESMHSCLTIADFVLSVRGRQTVLGQEIFELHLFCVCRVCVHVFFSGHMHTCIYMYMYVYLLVESTSKEERPMAMPAHS
jgi:hypothetical protein